MKLVIQRVKDAEVRLVETDKVAGQIGEGLLVLVGIKKGDSLKDAEMLAQKLSKLRVMKDDNGKMNLVSKEFLIVSQFTLYADTSGGNRPSFVGAAQPNDARKLYDHFIVKLEEKGLRVETGSFGDYMEIDAKLDGPVTIIFES